MLWRTTLKPLTLGKVVWKVRVWSDSLSNFNFQCNSLQAFVLSILQMMHCFRPSRKNTHSLSGLKKRRSGCRFLSFYLQSAAQLLCQLPGAHQTFFTILMILWFQCWNSARTHLQFQCLRTYFQVKYNPVVTCLMNVISITVTQLYYLHWVRNPTGQTFKNDSWPNHFSL